MYMYLLKIENSGVAIATVCPYIDPPYVLFVGLDGYAFFRDFE
jgi:hypothetical protein